MYILYFINEIVSVLVYFICRNLFHGPTKDVNKIPFQQFNHFRSLIKTLKDIPERNSLSVKFNTNKNLIKKGVKLTPTKGAFGKSGPLLVEAKTN